MKRNDELKPPGAARATYHIGAVAELTGLKRETIRVWERRYGVVTPERSDGGTRRFTEAHIVRLRLLRALCDLDHSIGTIAHLSDDELRDMLSASVDDRAAVEPGDPIRVAVLHGTLRERIDGDAAAHAGGELRVVHDAPTLRDFLDTPGEGASDVLVAALPLLGEAPIEALRRAIDHVRASSAIVIYHFAPQSVLASLVRFGARLVQGPVRTTALSQALVDQVTIHRLQAETWRSDDDLPQAAASTPPPRRYLDAELDQLRDLNSSIECDCPNHLAQLASALIAFEEYSRTCETTHPEDEELHAFLAHGAAQARSIVERLLGHALEHADVELDA